jgi:hypothetical protein
MGFLRDLFGKKEVKKVEDDSLVEKETAGNDVTVPVVKTYAFAFKFLVYYKLQENKKGEAEKLDHLYWTSDLYYDYRQALRESRDLMEEICFNVNKAIEENKKHIFIIDCSIETESFIRCNAYDVVLLEFTNGLISRAIDIDVSKDKNIIITPTSTENEIGKLILDGTFKIMKQKIDW